jgi:3'-phosphoadenosine 5'-phosphosulfate (PAPS) 3'-phosphatase
MANIALRAARKAADYLARSMDRPDQFQIQEKRHNDFVSNIDRTAEEIIIEQIRETYPNHRILAEESGEQSGDSEFTWVIDPLDGTLNFLQGIPHFAVSIGVMKGLAPRTRGDCRSGARRGICCQPRQRRAAQWQTHARHHPRQARRLRAWHGHTARQHVAS